MRVTVVLTRTILVLVALAPSHGFAPPAVTAAAIGSSNRAPTGRRRRIGFPFLPAGDQPSVASDAVPAAATATAAADAAPSIAATPPSWEELADSLPSEGDEQGGAVSAPLVTLYRDTNGWCPFCERVWVVLRAKGIPYDEQLISLQNKPDWYKALVPTSLVPAVLFHGSNKKKNERRIVWESMDVLRALDESFPDTPRMVHETPEFTAALSMNDDLTAAGFAYVYSGRNATLTDADREERRTDFLAELDRLDRALLDDNGGGGGPSFRLGESFTGLDAIMIPTLERWRYQLPLTFPGLDILENRPGLVAWFEAMDSFKPYADRVAGDEYSWTATNSMFLRYFGGGEDRPDVADAIGRADGAAEVLAGNFAKAAKEDEEDEENEGKDERSRVFAVEAARKLIANHGAVVADCTRSDPASQQHIGRGEDVEAADAVLRYVASVMLSSSGTGGGGVVGAAEGAPLPELSGDEARAAAAVAARTVASRLCVPRDMSAPAAKVLRGVLATVAGRLEEK